jgi:uncharacterized membrane protein YuzA (DUF378 family)
MSLIPPTLGKHWPTWGHLVFAAVAALLGALVLWQHLVYFAFVVIGFADLYLILMLLSAAAKSSPKRQETWPGLPRKLPALLILPCESLALVCAFGAVYLNTVSGINSRLDAAYFSFVNLATFTYDTSVLTTSRSKAIAVVQIASGLLLLICAIPLLVSRLADFGGGLKNLTFNGCKIVMPDSGDAEVTIAGDVFKWEKDGQSITASGPLGEVKVTCTEVFDEVTLLVIESETKCSVGHAKR